ncbi:MAG: hypothetical protein HYS75_05815 [Nitrosopumilales archaeon]|nr:hypothetical protein [Nitrosopumilales archaeon]
MSIAQSFKKFFKDSLGHVTSITEFAGEAGAYHFADLGIGFGLGLLGSWLYQKDRESKVVRTIAQILGVNVEEMDVDYVLEKINNDPNYYKTIGEKIRSVCYSGKIDEFAKEFKIEKNEACQVYLKIKDLVLDHDQMKMLAEITNSVKQFDGAASKLDDIKNRMEMLGQIKTDLDNGFKTTNQKIDYLREVIERNLAQKDYHQWSSTNVNKYGNSQVQLQISRAFNAKSSTVPITCFSKITEFWKQWREGYLKENQYVTFEGTLSKYIPMLIGDPREKIELHRRLRRENLERRQSEKNHLSADTILAFTAGQMVWRPKLSREYVILGLYHSIVRNSIPIFVSKNYFEKIQNQIFDINRYVVDIKLQGTLVKMDDTFESQFTGQKEISPEFLKLGKSKSLYAIVVGGNENTWLKDPTETTYLDGDIWVALETDNFHTTISRFLDLSDTSFLIDEAKALRNDWETKYPQARLIGQFDEVDKLVPESTEAEKMKDVF